MPTIWTLGYAMVTPEQQSTCRLHFTQLSRDTHVEGVTVSPCTFSSGVTILRVTFIPGFQQPRTPELQALDRRFGLGELENWPGVRVHGNYEHRRGLSFEWSQRYDLLPPWLLVGAWFRRKGTNETFQVRFFQGEELASVCMHQWRDIPERIMAVTLASFIVDFEECDAPVEGPSWHARLTQKDPYED